MLYTTGHAPCVYSRRWSSADQVQDALGPTLEDNIMKVRYEVMNLGSRDGFAMAATLGVLTLLSVLVVTVFANAMASFRSGMTDLEKTRTYYAAEAAAESGMADLALALKDAILEDQELSAIDRERLLKVSSRGGSNIRSYCHSRSPVTASIA